MKSQIELWGKRVVVDDEYTRLTNDEKSYVWFEEQRRVL